MVDVEANLDAAEFERIEPDFKAVFAFERLAGDFNGDTGERDRQGLRRRRGGGGRICGGLCNVLRRRGEGCLLHGVGKGFRHGGPSIGGDRGLYLGSCGVMADGRGLVARRSSGQFVGIAGCRLRLAVALQRGNRFGGRVRIGGVCFCGG